MCLRGILRIITLLLAAALSLQVAGPAVGAASSDPPRLTLGIIPSREAGRLAEGLRPLADLMGQRLGRPVVIFEATNYTGMIEAMGTGKVDIAIFGPFSLVLAEERHGVKLILNAALRGSYFYHSQIVVRADSGITRLSDLKGKRFAFVDSASASGYLFPYTMLDEAGINPDRDLRTVFAGSHPAAVLAVYRKEADAAGVFEGIQRDLQREIPDIDRVIRTIAVSPPIPTGSVAARRELDPALVRRIQWALINIANTPEGKKALNDVFFITSFEIAKSEQYEIVRKTYKALRDKIKI